MTLGRKVHRLLPAAFFIIWSTQAAAADWRLSDPFGVDGKVAPARDKRWESDTPLPVLPAQVEKAALPAGRALTLAELTEFALLHNPRTRQSWLAARASAAGVGIEQADLLPSLAATYGVNRTQQVSATTGTVVPWQTRYGPAFTLSYVLFDFGVRSLQREASEFRLLAGNLAHNRALQDVIFQVEQAYYRLIGADALVKANEQTLKNSETALEAAQKRRESGLATVADVYRTETLVAQARLNVTRSRGELEKARGQLAAAVGLAVNDSIRVVPLAAPPQTQQVQSSVSELLQRAKESRADLVAAESQVLAARATAKSVSRAGLPSIEVTGGGGHTGFNDNRPSVSNYAVGLTVRIPIFSGFRDLYSSRQATLQAEAAEASRDALVKLAEVEVWQGYYDLRTATDSIASTEAQVRSAEQTAQATLARYERGFGNILDLITAQQDESNARVQRIQSYLDWFTTMARLQLAVGATDIMTTAGGKK